MKHLGDITKINWFEVEPVDCVTGGSPCQDLSAAGKRAGLTGERSGLYMEQIRCTQELRQADEQRGRTGAMVRPRYMVWENVPGAFSSNGGKDFATVIEEAVRVVEPEAPAVPVPKKGWPSAGCLYDDMGRWSVAWRVHDAQHWGVPQRRKRIALVADFGGLSAPEVLFERKGLSGDFEQSGETGKETAGAVGGGVEGASTYCLQGNAIDRDVKMNGSGISRGPMFSLNTVDRHGVMCLNDQGGSMMSVTENVTGTLRRQEHGHRPIVVGFKHKQGALAGNIGYQEEQAPTLNAEQQSAVLAFQQNASGEVRQSAVGYTISTNSNPSGRNAPLSYDARGNGDCQTVCTLTGDHQNGVTDYTALCVGSGQLNQMSMGEQANTLDTMHDQQSILVAGVDCRNGYENEELSATIQAKENGGQSLNYINPVRCANVVRRLTPLECERLQGYPDGWTDIGDWTDNKGKKHKTADSPRYKALGNSIALPFWKWLLKRISAQYERDATLGSLFDGIGGFPLVWEQINGKGTARWASEIEEFPMAVTRLRFGEEANNG